MVRLGSLTVRIYGERGASMEKRDSEVIAIGLEALEAPATLVELAFTERYCG